LKAVVLTFDRMPAHLLGCYGNEWTETPGFDRLAALGSVFDRHFAEVPGPVGPNHSWWTGQFEFFGENGSGRSASDGDAQNWIQRLTAQGIQCRLVAEDSEGLPNELFSASEAVGGEVGLGAEHDEVPIARLIRRGIEILSGDLSTDSSSSDDNSRPELLWLHSRGVPSPWLPPRLFAELYLDELEEIVDGESGSEIAGNLVSQFEHDPDLVRLLLSDWRRDVESEDDSDDSSDSSKTAVPVSDAEPDEIDSPEIERQISRLVFAGYVSMIDRWLLKLLETIESSDEQILLVVSANQGHSFGETADLLPDAVAQSIRLSGEADAALHTQLTGSLNDTEVRTPLLIAEFSNPSGGQAFGSRQAALVQPVDVAVTLEHWLTAHWLTDAGDQNSAERENSTDQSLLAAISGTTPAGREVAFHLGPDGQLGIRNRHWALATSVEALNEPDNADADVRLFAKPDDQWDVHDVSSQYTGEVKALLDQLQARCDSR